MIVVEFLEVVDIAFDDFDDTVDDLSEVLVDDVIEACVKVEDVIFDFDVVVVVVVIDA